jgi:hypothetical protein
MGRKGDLLELIDGAPIGVHTLTGSVWRWKHYERSQRAIQELSQSHGGSVGIATFGILASDTSDHHLRVWLDLTGRWRMESEDYIDLRNGPQRWVGSSTRITEVTEDQAELEDTEMLMSTGVRPMIGAVQRLCISTRLKVQRWGTARPIVA